MKSQYIKLSSLFMLLILLTLFASFFPNEIYINQMSVDIDITLVKIIDVNYNQMVIIQTINFSQMIIIK